MEKNFNKWQELKPKINNLLRTPYFQERDVWWCAFGINIGSEQDGKNKGFERPVLILRKFNKNMFWGIPFTSKIRKDSFHYVYKDGDKERCAILSQLRLLDSRRLYRKIEVLSSNHFDTLREMTRKLI